MAIPMNNPVTASQLLSVVTFTVILLNALPVSSFDIVYMADHCGETFNSETGGFIEPDSSLTYSHNMDCTMVLEVPTDHKILLQFTRFALEPPTDGVCTDKVNIYDGSSVSSPSLAADLCDDLSVDDLMTTGNSVTLRLQTDAIGNDKGFAIIYTAFTDPVNGACPSEYLACSVTPICIPDALACNNYDHCGDGTDESDCADESDVVDGGLTVGQIIAIIMGVVCFGMLVGGIFYFVQRYHKAQRLTEEIMMTEKVMYPIDNVYTDKDFWGHDRPSSSHRRSGQT
ncbi:membrane frizzled-related protein-like [Ptychodera flava]|uniref:membrane frizzled-related protein-like n=1 Tax=Ptychodera flava TaxID=63121 RepID=UPI003969D443